MGRRTIDGLKLTRHLWLCMTEDMFHRVAAFAAARGIPKARALRMLLAAGLRHFEG